MSGSGCHSKITDEILRIVNRKIEDDDETTAALYIFYFVCTWHKDPVGKHLSSSIIALMGTTLTASSLIQLTK